MDCPAIIRDSEGLGLDWIRDLPACLHGCRSGLVDSSGRSRCFYTRARFREVVPGSTVPGPEGLGPVVEAFGHADVTRCRREAWIRLARFNPHPARRPDATGRFCRSSQPPMGFDSHLAFGPDATSSSVPQAGVFHRRHRPDPGKGSHGGQCGSWVNRSAHLNRDRVPRLHHQRAVPRGIPLVPQRSATIGRKWRRPTQCRKSG